MLIVYLRTQLVHYLVIARRMANYFLDNIPADKVIPWDFNAPLVSERPADTSAAMIAANGLLLLARIDPDSSAASYYSNAAVQVPFLHHLIAHLPYVLLNTLVDFTRHNERLLGA